MLKSLKATLLTKKLKLSSTQRTRALLIVEDAQRLSSEKPAVRWWLSLQIISGFTDKFQLENAPSQRREILNKRALNTSSTRLGPNLAIVKAYFRSSCYFTTQYSTLLRQQTSWHVGQSRYLPFRRESMLFQCLCVPKLSLAQFKTSLNSKLFAKDKATSFFWSISELWTWISKRLISWKQSSNLLLRRVNLRSSLTSARILRNSSLCWWKNSGKKRALSLIFGKDGSVMEKRRSKRGNHLNMIKTPKRIRTTKN